MVRSENGEASKHPDHIPKLPAQATHPGMASIGKVALRQLWPRVRHRFSWHCLCFFIAKNPWSAGRRSFVATSPEKYGSRLKGWCSLVVRVRARQPPRTCHAHAATVANSRGHPPRTSARHPCAEDDKAKVPEPARVVDAGWWQALTPHGVVDPAGTRVCQTLRASTGAPP